MTYFLSNRICNPASKYGYFSSTVYQGVSQIPVSLKCVLGGLTHPGCFIPVSRVIGYISVASHVTNLLLWTLFTMPSSP